MTIRGEFSSKFGFIMAAVGSAVGLGNIWAFPTNTAQNGGAVFVLLYLLLAFCLAYPVLMAELTIGRHAQANPVDALRALSTGHRTRILALVTGISGTVCGSLILCFYSIVAGWMLRETTVAGFRLFGVLDIPWHSTASRPWGDVGYAIIFLIACFWIVAGGVKHGIERWSSRLMPAMLVILCLLIAHVLQQPGAHKGLVAYLLPDLSKLSRPSLLLDAMGQAFFSLSLGVGTMMVYGSYLSKKDSLPKLAAWVTFLDVGIAFLAGLLIIPAMYAAEHLGIRIFADDGSLVAGPALILQVLPSLFENMGSFGTLVSFSFFALMSIAALTSAISMLEVPVSVCSETLNLPRSRVAVVLSIGIMITSSIIALNFDLLFSLVVTITTEYGQPLLSLIYCLFLGWIWKRHALLNELRKGSAHIEHTFFWKIWPTYVKFVCPLFIIGVIARSL